MRHYTWAAVFVGLMTCTAAAVTLVEDFNSGIPPERWTVVNVGAVGAPWSVYAPDASGGIRISKAADNDAFTDSPRAGIQSRFALDGDFTASVGFNLLFFPLADSGWGWNEAIIHLTSQTTGQTFSSLRLSDYFNQGVEGFSSLPPNQLGNGTDSTTTGRLGVSRSGSTMTAWIDRGSGPVVLGSIASAQLLGPMSVDVLAIQKSSYDRPHNALDIRYDDFQATADSIVPEPAAALLLFMGLGLVTRRCCRNPLTCWQ